MFKVKIELTGLKFGRWTVLGSPTKDKYGKLMWLCRCDCGTEKNVNGGHLRQGATKSCGCYKIEKRLKHGMTKTPIHHKWIDMKKRCTNPKCNNYKNYGARGITVCEEWSNSFISFMEWSLLNGYSDELEIDRIDNDKGYSPENCRYVTKNVNNFNKRTNRLIEINGETKAISQWGQEYGLMSQTIHSRTKRGITGADLISPSIRRKKNDATQSKERHHPR